MYVAIFGALSIILPFFNLQLKILTWIDNWGETTSWAIKIGLIVVGAALFLMGGKAQEAPADNPAEE